MDICATTTNEQPRCCEKRIRPPGIHDNFTQMEETFVTNRATGKKKRYLLGDENCSGHPFVVRMKIEKRIWTKNVMMM
ncbi:hypothetical protein OUZ56_022769 [Daphnia magna]|uniref:Uncharacterized protein n=1 Tax=Daphnia magna TaxID=35525 RepID=A0ABR0AXG8_9CRUS|nr:hypothetical protein OUZ56_022769 [Daphnia magna]